jgi:hypothetical protein
MDQLIPEPFFATGPFFSQEVPMPSITLNAHFDGQSIVLDEPFELPSHARLLVTVVSPLMDSDRAQWSDLAGSGLALAYGDDEPEYRLTDVKRP